MGKVRFDDVFDETPDEYCQEGKTLRRMEKRQKKKKAKTSSNIVPPVLTPLCHIPEIVLADEAIPFDVAAKDIALIAQKPVTKAKCNRRAGPSMWKSNLSLRNDRFTAQTSNRSVKFPHFLGESQARFVGEGQSDVSFTTRDCYAFGCSRGDTFTRYVPKEYGARQRATDSLLGVPSRPALLSNEVEERSYSPQIIWRGV